MTDEHDQDHEHDSEDWLVELTDDEMAQLEIHGTIGRSSRSEPPRR